MHPSPSVPHSYRKVTSEYWVHIGFEPPFREFFIEVLDAEHRTPLVWEEYSTLDELVRAAALWTDLDRAHFDEMFGLDAFAAEITILADAFRPLLCDSYICDRGMKRPTRVSAIERELIGAGPCILFALESKPRGCGLCTNFRRRPQLQASTTRVGNTHSHRP